jgi:hypothetical protein
MSKSKRCKSTSLNTGVHCEGYELHAGNGIAKQLDLVDNDGAASGTPQNFCSYEAARQPTGIWGCFSILADTQIKELEIAKEEDRDAQQLFGRSDADHLPVQFL